MENFDLHSWQISAIIVWSQYKSHVQVCVPTIYGKLYPRLICCPDHTVSFILEIFSFPQSSVRSLSTWFSSCSSSTPSTSTVVSTTFPSSTPTLTLLSLELAPQVPSRLFVHQFLVLTFSYICVNIIICILLQSFIENLIINMMSSELRFHRWKSALSPSAVVRKCPARSWSKMSRIALIAVLRSVLSRCILI